MTFLLSTLIFFGLAVVSVLHLMWSLGFTFPCADELSLARTVAGFRGIDQMPPRWASLLVAILMLFCAMWPAAITRDMFGGVPALWLAVVGFGLAVVFTARGVLGFTAWWRNMTPEQPFARLDRRYYSPFCLAVGIGFFWTTMVRLL